MARKRQGLSNAKTRGFLNRTEADAWIAEQKRAREGKPE